MSKIYTKTGDRGTTGTFHGRMAKSDQLTQALGTIDELNSWIGLCRSQIFNTELKKIQNNLLTIGSQLAGSEKRIKPGETAHLEKLIDKLTKDLPKLTNFIYPMGYLQVARAVCRRAEREVVAAAIKEKNILKYLNRLSDALFTMGRWVNFKLGWEEEVWRG
ncbi:MAG: ATP:cob(I)alamin adenosyltransferase [Candidatus Azambacteria bacterium GW2011_GWA1_44_9]|uniref:Corrinoid adenosyltransferase n=1 Tax=Candidatus Azambacteria bacterium GW2011_GWA1_44_9 TaxID=1618610 RepID=A0A0G1NAP1_9BACT|nr:MAG: ATP:cob(I)alamin adenosyltransferase [Candidatus Azambacteria bacterium GW2011_GWA1_44_9]